ncbi:MAG: replication initiation protein [Gammaproteobacteria bacterium]
MTQKKQKELKKHVGAIHSVHEGGLLQRKMCNALLAHAYQDLLKKETHCISVAELSKMIGYRSNDTKQIKNCLVSLQQTNVQWNVINPETGQKQWGTAGLIGEAIIEGSTCFYSYTPGMRKILFEPEMYGRIDLTIQSRFQSAYGLALYENCIRYQDIPQTPWFELNVFRALLGVPEGKYPIFRDLKRRVIDKAVAEVNEYSPVQLEYEIKSSHLLKPGKARREKIIEAIRFLISKKMNTQEAAIGDTLSKEFGVEAQQAKRIVKKFGVKTVQEKIEITKALEARGGEAIRNKAGFVVSAITNDYQKPAKLKTPSRGKAYKTVRELEQDETTLLAEKVRKQETILKWFSKQGKRSSNKLLKEFSGYISEYFPVISHLLDIENPLDNPVVRDILIAFLAGKIPLETEFEAHGKPS